MPNALIVEDSDSSRDLYAEWLRLQGFEPIQAGRSIAEATSLLRNRSYDLVLLDLQLPDGNGVELLTVLEAHPDAEVVVITGHQPVDPALDAMRGGAIEYLTKPVDLRRLQKIVTKCRLTIDLRAEVASLRDELRRTGRSLAS